MMRKITSQIKISFNFRSSWSRLKILNLPLIKRLMKIMIKKVSKKIKKLITVMTTVKALLAIYNFKAQPHKFLIYKNFKLQKVK